MAIDVNGVKTERAAKPSYHHGNLRASLMAAALEIIEESGPHAFSLRAAARRAGVSPAAPAHHFNDARGLLTAIATVGFVELGDALEAAGGFGGRLPVTALARTYLTFAFARPGLFRLMWRKEALDLGDVGHMTAARRAFTVSDRAVRGAGASFTSPDDPALAPTIAVWSLVHGLVMLMLDGAFFANSTSTPKHIEKLLDATLMHLNLDGR